MEIKRVGVIGAGTMGSGIASVVLAAGLSVVLVDVVESSLEKAKSVIAKNLQKSFEKGKIDKEPESLLANLTLSTGFNHLVDVQLVIEAVSENPDIKNKVFTAINENTSKGTIIASNTSALNITTLAQLCKEPDHVLGMHFFNPAMIMKLVELVKTDLTSAQVFESAKCFVCALGKEPVTVKESSGFIVNRVLIPMINEAAMIYAEGIATAEDIDKAMKLGANHPIGPLALADLIGLDVCQAIMETLAENLDEHKYKPAPIFKELINANKLGKKSGEGFFSY